jgi:putative protease
MHKPEILAPAGSMEAFKAAILNGADAVYLGGKLFNARQNAANFDEQELEKAVRWAHSRQVKVYVTVNILLHNEELETALHYLKFLYHIGVDGIIVQDLGLLMLAKEAIPELKLHGSTQMTIHNLQGAKFFADKGLERIVLARELSFKDIVTIRRGCDLELEVFVHGALCICYSGQCLMSSMIGGRSGNRGRCAQPCRLPYGLETASGKPIKAEGDYLLSPKDLATIDLLPELVASGVHSLKFEGRMKRPEYVATVIRVYRKALDRCLADPEGYQATSEEKRQLAQIFNRDFTTGYYHQNPGGNLISYQRPNNRGILLGRINKINAKKKLAAVKLDQPLNVGDGIEYWVSKGGRTGVTVKEIFLDGSKVSHAAAGSLVEIEAPVQARSGDRVFKTHDAELMTMAQAGMDEEMEIPKTPLKMSVSGSLGEPLQLIVKDHEGNEGRALTDFLAEEAQKRPLTKEVLAKQLGRLGTTDYVLEELELDLPHNLMVPLSELNDLRRKAIAQLDRNRHKGIPVPFNEDRFNRVIASLECREKAHSQSSPKLSVSVGDPQSLEAAVSAGADCVYISGERFRSKRFDLGDYGDSVKEAGKRGVQVYYGLPRLWLDSNEPALGRIAKEIERLPVSGVVVSNPGGVRWVRERFPGLPLVLDYSLNLMNDFSIRFLADQWVECITLSPELTFQEIKDLCVPPKLELEGIVQGALPLMISEHCVVGGVVGCRTENQPCSGPCKGKSFRLRDRKNYYFPVEMDQFCRMHIFNSQDLCLIEHLPHFRELGYHRLRIEARGQAEEYVRKTTGIYRKALNELEYGQKFNGEELRHLLAELSHHGLTKGHYFRGV